MMVRSEVYGVIKSQGGGVLNFGVFDVFNEEFYNANNKFLQSRLIT